MNMKRYAAKGFFFMGAEIKGYEKSNRVQIHEASNLEE